MKEKLLKIVIAIAVGLVCYPLAYLGIGHGSSSGLDIGIFLIICHLVLLYYLFLLSD